MQGDRLFQRGGRFRKGGAQGPQEMGHVMKVVMPQISGRADGKVVSQLVKTMLAKAPDPDE